MMHCALIPTPAPRAGTLARRLHALRHVLQARGRVLLGALVLAAAIPGTAWAAELTVTPEEAAPGATLTLTATGFPPHETVEIGAGPPHAEYDVIATGRTDGDGRLEHKVKLLDDLAEESVLVFVVATEDFRVKAVSPPVRVVPYLKPTLVGTPPRVPSSPVQDM